MIENNVTGIADLNVMRDIVHDVNDSGFDRIFNADGSTFIDRYGIAGATSNPRRYLTASLVDGIPTLNLNGETLR